MGIRLVRVPILVAGMASLVLAMGAALVRLGWEIPLPNYDMLISHGPLMVSGFLGTLIGLERAVALNRPWTYIGPCFTGLGGISIALYPGWAPGEILITAGSSLLVLAYIPVLNKQTNLSSGCMAGGALSWLLGNSLWFVGWPVYTAVPWWIGFLLLTVAGERLELSRMLQPSRVARRVFLAAILLFCIGGSLTALGFGLERTALRSLESGALQFPSGLFGLGCRIFGLSLTVVGIWLLKWDLARKNIRRPQLPRFMAVCLLSGFLWLSVSGSLFIYFGPTVSGLPYDTQLHTFFLGFAFSMIFAHAPIIFPAVLRVQVNYTPAFYFHLVLLNLSLTARVFSNLGYDLPGRQWSSMANAASVVVFLLVTAHSVIKGLLLNSSQAGSGDLDG